jgi:hypothetical protein
MEAHMIDQPKTRDDDERVAQSDLFADLIAPSNAAPDELAERVKGGARIVTNDLAPDTLQKKL